MQFNDKVQFIKVEPPHEGQRLDNFLMRLLKGVPRSRVYRLIRRGEVRVDKKRAKPEKRLACGETVRIPPYAGQDPSTPPPPSPQLSQALQDSIVSEQAGYLVLNKPAGLAVHGGSGIRLGLIEALRQIRPEWQGLELAHRLDRDTSGCLVIAKDAGFLKDLHSQLKAKTVVKRYLALVHGHWPETLVEVDAPLLKNELSSGERMVRVDATGKPSRTRFRVLARYPGATLVEALPETGRTHQIRVHCQSAGYPIVGDEKYVQTRLAAGLEGPLAGAKNLCLHADSIRFTEPDSGAEVSYRAELDSRFRQLLDALEK